MTLWHGTIGLAVAATLACAASVAGAYEEAPVNGGGTIKGKVVYRGEVPMRTILPTKDQQVCGQMRQVPEVKVGPDGAVEDSVVYLDGWRRARLGPPTPRRRSSTTTTADFVPDVQAIPAGTLAVAQLGPGAAQHPRLLRQAHRLQHRLAQPGPAHRCRAQAGRSGAGRLRRPRLDARLDLRGRQPLLRGDRRRRHLRRSPTFRPATTP